MVILDEFVLNKNEMIKLISLVAGKSSDLESVGNKFFFMKKFGPSVAMAEQEKKRKMWVIRASSKSLFSAAECPRVFNLNLEIQRFFSLKAPNCLVHFRP